jgi:hypothetical protein
MAGSFMPIGDFKVTYVDGGTEVVQSNFRGLVEVERKWPGDTIPGVEAMGFAVWHYLGCPDEFDTWLDTVHLIEKATTEGEVQPGDPTPPAVGDD